MRLANYWINLMKTMTKVFLNPILTIRAIHKSL
ncbi:conserved protein of unknown function [Ectopseudomonas oleovorans]|uniref:Uncharacterized protein n=1 Tax=Ectopseudomonas oleovorans TaxID=301 RepID=A0A653B039_ECTOL|nr:conserved protein of unknown function [Pseudomonas oleovorans]